MKRESTASEYNILDVYTLIVQSIRAIINQLPDQEQRIINGRSGTVDGKYNTFTELLKELHVTYERVRQLQEKAIRRIKMKLEEAGIRSLHIQLVLNNAHIDREINSQHIFPRVCTT